MRDSSYHSSKSKLQSSFQGGDKKVMKKSLSVVLGGALAFGAIAGAASAAAPTDVQGTSYQSAVEELNALGVINGYTDGTFKPDNQITRAELAKIIVVASGNDSAATIMQNVKPTFSDVKSGVWYTGYINVAATKGLIKGDAGTKKFRPNDKIKFEEVVALLVRALGYKESALSGTWPYNYIVKAQDIGILDGVDLTKGDLANRGAVAKLVDNAINLPTVTYDENGNEVTVGNPKLITKIGNASSAVLTAPSLSDGKVNLDGKDVAVASNFTVTGGKALADLLGHDVTVIKSGSKVVALSDAQDADQVVTLNNDNDTDTVGYSSTLDFDGGKSYTTVASTEALYYYNNLESKGVNGTYSGDVDTTLFLNDNGKVRFVSVVTYQENKLFASYEAKTDAHSARITTADNFVLNLTDDAVVTLDGKVASAADLKANDVIRYVQKTTAGTVTKVEATRQAVTGKIEKVRDDGTNFYYTVAGVEHKDVISGSHASGVAAHAVGDEYTFFLNKDGQIAGEKAVNNANGSSFAVMTEPASTPTDGVVVDGVVQKGYTVLKAYSFKDNKVVTLYTAAGNVYGGNPVDNQIVKVTYDASGNVTRVDNTGVNAVTSAAAVTAVSGNSVTAGGTYLVNSNTIYLDATQASGNTFSLTTADKVTKGDNIAFVQDATNAYNAAVVVLTKDSETGDAAADVYGVFKSKYSVQVSSTQTNYYVDLNVKGETKTIQLESDIVPSGLQTYQLVHLKDVNAPFSKYDATAATYDTSSVVGNVYVANSTFYLNSASVTGHTDYIATANTTFYVVDAAGNVSVGSIQDLKQAADDYAANNAHTYYIGLTESGTTIGTFTEAGAVVIKKTY